MDTIIGGRGARVAVTVTVAALVVMSLAVAPAAGFLWFGGGDDTDDTPPGDEPVVLVHGFGDASWTPWWDELEDNLVEAGYSESDIYRVDLGNLLTTVDSPDVYAEEVCDQVKEVWMAEGFQEVDVIGHSMGGLDARYCVERLGGDKYVDDVVTMGTPHQGTYAAHLGFFTPAGEAMEPGSDFLTDLNSDGLSDNVEYTAVWGSLDEAVIFNRYAKVKSGWHDGNAKNVWAGFKAHIQMVHDDGTFESYEDRLD
jgi:triacylglycerol lipase